MEYLKETLERVEEYAATFLTDRNRPLKAYHNLYHTQQVVKACIDMALFYRLTDQQYFIVITAAWFHDIAYFEGAYEHEERGAAQVAEYLRNESVSDTIIDAVKNCILATKLPQKPRNLLEEIICDADLSHLGSSDFEIRSELMKEEMEGALGRKIKVKDWKEATLELLEDHHYFTSYCKQMLSKQKDRNVLKLKSEIETFHDNSFPTDSL